MLHRFRTPWLFTRHFTRRFTRSGWLPLAAALLVLTGCGEDSAPPRPAVIKVLPAEGRTGESISIWGENLGTNGKLTVAGAEVAPVVWSPSRIEFVIPAKMPAGDTSAVLTIGGVPLAPLSIKVLAQPPEISDVEPFRGRVGDVATLKGQNFGNGGPDSGVNFYGTDAKEIASWKPTEIKFKIPKFKEFGFIQVRVGQAVSNQVGYRLIKPEPAEVQPPGNLPGRTVIVKGQAFGETPGQVLIGAKATPAKIVKWGDRAIEIQLPEKLELGAQQQLKVVNDNGPSLPSSIDVYGAPPEGPLYRGGKESRFVDMNLDETDFPHVIWYEEKSHCAVLLRWNGLKWELGPLQVPLDPRTKILPNAGWYPSLYSEADGTEHATFYNLYYSQLQYGVFSAAAPAWKYDFPDLGSKNCGVNSCVRRAPDGTMLISYFDQAGGHLKLARGHSGAWKLEDVDTGSQVGLSSSMVVDRDGNPHIAYLDFALKQLKYAHWDAAAKKWQVEWLTGDGVPKPHNHVGPPHGPAFPSLKLDSKGTPHVAYFYRQGDMPRTGPEDEDGVRHAVRVNGKWVHKLIEKGDQIGFAPTLEITRKDQLVVGYFGKKDSTARLAISSGDGNWTVKNATIAGLDVPEEPGAAAMRLGRDGKARFVAWVDRDKAKHLVLKVFDAIKD